MNSVFEIILSKETICHVYCTLFTLAWVFMEVQLDEDIGRGTESHGLRKYSRSK